MFKMVVPSLSNHNAPCSLVSKLLMRLTHVNNQLGNLFFSIIVINYTTLDYIHILVKIH